MSRTKVLIIGCGFAGTTLALFLEQAGIESEIYEAREASDLDAGAFLFLAPNGMNILKTLGLDGALEPEGIATTGITFYNRRGKEIGELDNRFDGERYGARGHVLKRETIFNILRNEVERQGIPLHFGKRLERVAQAVAGVQATFEDSTTATGDVLIGADGINSSTRQIILPNSPRPSYLGLVDTGGFANLPSLRHLTGPQHMVFGKRAFFGYVVKPSGEVFWFSNVPWEKEPSRAELNTIPDETWKNKLLELHRDDPEPVLEIIKATPARGLGKWPTRDMPALPLWYQGAVCVMGDAAHATSPSAGQGASMALEDAMVLGKCLRDIADSEKAFATFQGLRKTRVEALIGQARRNGSRKIPNPVMGFIRDVMLPQFLKVGAKGTHQTYAYKVNWSEKIVSLPEARS
jgi:2-polyprenyl-6-methoxyphenol hydroxylase-like FAD-dependent oxidoreductase